MTRRRMRVGAVLAVLLASGGERASAATFCVGDPSCPGAQVGTLADAVTEADTSPGIDVVVVGAGTFTGARFAAGNPVHITGAGRAQTIVEGLLGQGVALELADPASTARLLGVRIPDQDGAVGLRLGGTGDELTVTPANPAVVATAVELLDGAVLTGASAESPVGAGSWAVDVVPTARAKVERVRLRGGGLRARAASLTATRSLIDVSTGPAALADDGGLLRLDTALVRSLPGSGGGLRAEAATVGHDASVLTARGVTLIGASEDGRPALSARAVGGVRATVQVDDSILRGFRLERVADGERGGDAGVNVAYSNFDPAADVNQAVGTGHLSPFDGSESRTYGTIRFVDPTAGDYRLRADSPVIDRGTPGALLVEDSPLDLDGLARVADGNGVAGATRDMGAYEYQRRPPLLTASAQPALAPVGTPMRFEAQVSDPDPGDEVAVRWAFDDGGVLTGPAGDYAFATPGPHSATVTATDSAGAETTRTVLVRALPPAPVVGSAPPAVDLVAPRFDVLSAALRVNRSGRIPIKLACPASEPEPCRGTLLLRTLYPVSTRPVGSRAAPSRVTLAAMTVKVYPGGERLFRPKLRAAGVRLMRRRDKVRARLQIDAYDPAGNHRLLRRDLTFRAAENASRERAR